MSYYISIHDDMFEIYKDSRKQIEADIKMSKNMYMFLCTIYTDIDDWGFAYFEE